MRLIALLSWHDESPDDLQACIRSLSFCDALVAVSGAYALWPDPKPVTPAETDAIVDACEVAGLDLLLYRRDEPWQGNEVEKRSFIFQLARQIARPMHDWYLIMDGDDQVHSVDEAALRRELDTTVHDVGWLTLGTTFPEPWAYTGPVTQGFRKLFRALPELTVIGTHWYFVGRRDTGDQVILWGDEKYHPIAECVDVRELLTVHHRKNIRDEERDAKRAIYYTRKEHLERIPTGPVDGFNLTPGIPVDA